LIEKFRVSKTGIQNGRLNAGNRSSKTGFIPEFPVFSGFPGLPKT